MDCQTIRILADFNRPGVSELDPAESRAFRAHIDDCPDCRAQWKQRTELGAHLGRVMRGIDVPNGLKERLLAAMRERRKTTYRRWLIGSAAAAAAVILLAISVFVAIDRRERDSIVADNRTRKFDTAPAVPLPDADHPDAVEQWFLDRYRIGLRLPAAIKERWDFHFLKSRSVTRSGKVSIPVLEFATVDSLVRVYLLPADKFGPANLPNFGQSRGARRYLLDTPADEPYRVLVVVVKGDDSEFLKPESRLVV